MPGVFAAGKPRLSSLLIGCLALAPVALLAQSVPLTQDTYVTPGNTLNFGTSTTIAVGGAGLSQGLVQFDLSTLPSGTAATNVARATLAFFVNKVTTAGTVNISAANGTWTEAGVNGTNAPVAGAAVASGVSVASVGSWIYVDATSAVQAWLSGTTNNGFLVTPLSAGVNIAFDSKESTTTSHPATLTIALQSAGSGILSSSVVTSSTTISGTSVVYLVSDGVTVTLPPATTRGQQIIMIGNVTGVVDLNDFHVTIQAATGDFVNTTGFTSTSTVLFSSGYVLVSDGNHHWTAIGNN